jgi:glycosyltransferase involved in cell wall biosynthesis
VQEFFMKIGIDMRPALSRKTGVGHYIHYLAKHLIRRDEGNQYYLFSASFKERFSPRLIPGGRHNVTLVDRKMPVRILNHLWHHYGYPPLDGLCGTDLDITHSPTPMLLPGKKARKIVTVHDLYFLAHPEHATGEMKKDYPGLVEKNLRQADAVVCNSETTLREIETRLHIRPALARVISPGLPEELLGAEPAGMEELRAKFRIRGKFLLHVGMIEPRKNIPVLLEAFRLVRRGGYDDLSLVLAGPRGWGWPEVESMLERYQLEDRVRVTGYLEEETLAGLYRQAELLVFPSRWEGFGLPLLEAMALGLPAVISPAPALAELAGEGGALVFGEERPEALAEAVTHLLSHRHDRQAFAEKGKKRSARFSWETSAMEMIALYEELARDR